MAYHVLDPSDVEPTADYPCERRSIAEPTGLSTVAAAIYKLAPGEELARSYHYHEQREELFYVLSGTLTIETPELEYEVPDGSVFVATPNSPIHPYNPPDAAESTRVFACGAPQYDIGRSYDRESDNRDNSGRA